MRARATSATSQVRGPNVLPGYWRLPEKNKEEFTADGFFRTGDMGSFSTDGYLSIVGRSKDLIITGGYNVYPKEIELALDELPGVQRVGGGRRAASGLRRGGDRGRGAAPRAPRRRAKPRSSRRCKSASRTSRSPSGSTSWTSLPRNAMGKVQKNVLRDRYTGE